MKGLAYCSHWSQHWSQQLLKKLKQDLPTIPKHLAKSFNSCNPDCKGLSEAENKVLETLLFQFPDVISSTDKRRELQIELSAQNMTRHPIESCYKLSRKIAELEILLVSLKKPVIQPVLHRKPVRGDLLLCNRWQTSAQVCICC